MVVLLRFVSLFFIFSLKSVYAAQICGHLGTITERIEDCKSKNSSDEKYQNYLKLGFFVFSVSKNNEYFFTDSNYQWGYTEARSNKHECEKPYRKIKKSFYKNLVKRGIETDKGYHRCAMRVDRFILISPSRKERFQ